ncbi:MAG TPA: BrnT family toxin [Chloroflexia bacterium]|nr:BrnT family toxin [Chloroflexia bacterium]
MDIVGLIWLEEIIEKLARKHHVEIQEVRETLANSPSFRLVERGQRPGENVYSASGQSDSGRYLIIFFIYKNDKRALIVSARDMTAAERRRYGRK